MKMKLGGCLVVLGISIAWIFFQPGRKASENETTLDVTSRVFVSTPMTFNLDTQDYSAFLGLLRGQLRHPTQSYYGIPMMNVPTNPPNYILLTLVSTTKNVQMTVQIDKNSLYIVGYLDQYNGRDRGHYFTDAPRPGDIFPNAPQRQPIKCKGSYQGLEGESGKARETMQLSLGLLGDYMKNAYGKDSQPKPFGKIQATFLLMAVEMISEAARFKYIEDKADDFFPDYKVPSLENKWDPLSKAIISSNKGVFKNPIELVDAHNNKYTVKTVDDVKKDISILQYNLP